MTDYTDRKPQEINLQSDAFEGMRNNLDLAIHEVISKIFNEEFESGDIALKLTIEIPKVATMIPTANPVTGEIEAKPYDFLRPSFKFAVTTTLQQKYKSEGLYAPDKELVADDDEYYIVSLPKTQMTMEV